MKSFGQPENIGIPQLVPTDYTAAGLMGSKDEYLGYLDVSRSIGSVDGYIGNIIACQWCNAFIDMGSPFVVTMETDIAEVCLDKSRLQSRYADSRIGHIYTESVRQCLDGRLCGAIHIAAGVCSIASH